MSVGHKIRVLCWLTLSTDNIPGLGDKTVTLARMRFNSMKCHRKCLSRTHKDTLSPMPGIHDCIIYTWLANLAHIYAVGYIMGCSRQATAIKEIRARPRIGAATRTPRVRIACPSAASAASSSTGLARRARVNQRQRRNNHFIFCAYAEIRDALGARGQARGRVACALTF